MKKIYALLTSVLVASLFVTSCNVKDFGDINKDPNKPSTPFTTYLFTESCKYVQQFVLRDATNAYDPWQQEWAGYLSESKNNQYGPLSTTSSFGCSTFYLRPIKNLEYIVRMNEDPEQKDESNVAVFGTSANQIAAAKTLMAFFYMTISDINGPIVISEAFKGVTEDNWQPKYDTQKQAYTILDESLKAAYAQFDESGSLSGAADILFGGDIAKWKKFNASLRMLMAIKLSDVDAATGKARFAAAYADGGMKDVADGLHYTYDDLNWNMLYYWVSPDYPSAGLNPVPNYFIVEEMKALEDPRMFEYFDIEGYKGARDEEVFPRDQYSSFYGVPFGLINNDAVSAWKDCCASINSKIITQSATIPVIPTSRVLLVEAEAAQRGWISANAKDLYEAGIKASFDWWGAKNVNAYLANPAVAFNPDKGIEQIALQRWIAGYLADGIEAWSDWRRLDVPHMPVGPGADTQGNSHYPYRLPFDNTMDKEYNPANYAEAIKDLSNGQDTKDARVWWDVKDNWEGVLTEEQCKPTIVLPAKWEEVSTGTVAYDDTVYQGDPQFENHAATLYEDVNHPGTFKIAPFGETELVFTEIGTDEYSIGNQIIASSNGVINVADYNVDQEATESGICVYDGDDACYYFLVIMRNGGPRGGGSTGIAFYGYVAFIPD